MSASKFLVLGSALCLIANLSVAAPALRPFDAYVKKVAVSTGRTEKEIREEAIETLREEDKYSTADLNRIGRRNSALDASLQSEMVNLLKTSASFHAKIGLVSVRNNTIADLGDEVFTTLATESSTSAGGPPPEAVVAFDISRDPIEDLVGLDVTVDMSVMNELSPDLENSKPIHGKVISVPTVESHQGSMGGKINYAVTGDLVLKVGKKTRKVSFIGDSYIGLTILVPANTFPRDHTPPKKGLLVIGNVFTSPALGEVRFTFEATASGKVVVNKQRLAYGPKVSQNVIIGGKLKNIDNLLDPQDPSLANAKWIVEATENSGGSYSRSDYYPDGWGIWARRLNSDGSYNPNGQYVFFRQTGPFNNKIDDVKIVRRSRKK